MEPSFRAKLVERRTYSRPKGDGTFETWDEIIDRVIGHQKWLWSNAQGGDLNQAQKKELGDLKTLLLNRQVMLAGRTLWLGGTDVAKRRQATNFNCSFLRIKTIHDIVDAYWLLMQGCGVGFEPITGVLSGFNRPCNDVEIIRSRGSVSKGREHNIETYVDGLWTISVGDSAEAWVKAVGKLFAEKRPISKLVLDFSEIRVAGTRLSQYGWISSGDSTIAIALPKIITLLNGAAGRLLTKIEILDVMNWLGTTLSSRRSAEIALLPYHDPEADAFIDAKSGAFYNDNPQRTQSNNSVVFWTKPPKRELKGMFQTLVDNGGAEPGFINGSASYERAKYFAGVNPCVPGDTPILTDKGYINIKDVVNTNINIWDGKVFVEVIPFSTGVNSLVTVEFSDGTSLTCTPTHEFVVHGRANKVAAEDLVIGSKLTKFNMPVIDINNYSDIPFYSQGFYSGDGNSGYEFSWIYEPKYSVIPRLRGTFTHTNYNRKRWAHGPMLDKNWVPFNFSVKNRLDWLAGLLDADGVVLQNPNSQMLQLSSVNKNFLLRIRLMLTTLGVQAKVSSMHEEGNRKLPDGCGSYKNYNCQATWRLLINSSDLANLVNIGLNCSRLDINKTIPQRDARRFVTVTSVEFLDKEEETFCFTNKINGTGTFNGIVTGQCAEILLGDKSFCNLVDINLPSFNNNWSGLHDAVRLIARANYRQTCVDLRDGILQASWHELNDFLRLTGVGLTGVMEWEHKDNPKALEQLREIAKGSVAVMAHELDLPPSQNTTTVKPSGTLSKLMDTTEGIHKPLGKYIFNNINFSKDDPLIELCRRAGYKVFENPLSTDGMLVTVPVKYKDCGFTDVNGTLVNNDSAIDQLERYKRMMLHYVDHNCSNTISYSPDEVPAIVDWLDKNWDTYVGVSWLFRNDPTKRAVDLGFAYLPQEVVTKEEYESYKSTLKEVNFNNQLGSEDLSMVDDGCASGQCPIR